MSLARTMFQEERLNRNMDIQPDIVVDISRKGDYLTSGNSDIYVFGTEVVKELEEYAHYPYPRKLLGFKVNKFVENGKETNLPKNIENVEAILVYFYRHWTAPILLKVIVSGEENDGFRKHFYIKDINDEWKYQSYDSDTNPYSKVYEIIDRIKRL
ncbi:hypothetical protein BEWA_044830 [Theileria equi strain WA]|uniref:Uncharacterized protein n=1 Tax=Theileria equi strain WA TaxID=1537102 RepID=L1LGZ7_THEEQ|nr:hypothetical protein BEWA_044830 [Theileria equi strain WA]EKX74403.1 hypothetical protein BEWA_044830 [Theileria equi strain WA]|eukprot:XP_004833855.1 hypothetical protein BEWA_044830 [Theileria equi strain WA]